MTVERELLELEHRFWNAAGDPAFYEEHMAEDGRCLLPPGIFDKRATVAAVAGAPPWDTHLIQEPMVIRLGEDSAVLCYRGEGVRGEQRYVAAISSLYRRERGRWRLLVHQQTPLAS